MQAKIILLMILFCVIITASCHKKNTEMASAEIEKQTGPDEIIENVMMVSTTKDKVEWQMNATLSKRFTADKFMIAYEVTMETLNMTEKNFYSSDSVYVYEIRDEFIGMGNVEIITPRARLKTQKIIWNRLTDTVYAPDEVYVVRDNHQMWGTSLYTNSTLDYINLQNVRGQGVVDDNVFNEL